MAGSHEAALLDTAPFVLADGQPLQTSPYPSTLPGKRLGAGIVLQRLWEQEQGPLVSFINTVLALRSMYYKNKKSINLHVKDVWRE